MNYQIDNMKSKRIKKLAQRCTTYHKVDFGMYEESGVDLEQFAKLIIQECQTASDKYIAEFGEVACLPQSIFENYFELKRY